MRGLRAQFENERYIISSEDAEKATEKGKSIKGIGKDRFTMKFPSLGENEDGDVGNVQTAIEYLMVREGKRKSSREFVQAKVRTLLKWGITRPDEASWVRLYSAHETEWARDTSRLYWWAMNVWARALGMPEIPKPKFNGRRGKRQPVTEEELRAMLDVAKKDGMTYTIVNLMTYTGMRNGEIRALRTENVDLKANVIHVVDGGYHDGTKHGDADDVPIHPDFRPILERYMAARERFMSSRGISNQYLFFCEQYEMLDKTYLNQLIDRLAKKAGITRRIFPHLFRHALCDRLRREGISESEIMIISRHRSANSLHQYMHPTLKEVAEKFGRIKLY